jgi:hypothetical protein
MEISRNDKLAQLDRILQSHAFQGSESLRSFLRFVVSKTIEDHEDQLKEYTIATEVFGRAESYNPKIDSVVRVQAGRLRVKLQEYYATEGKSDAIVIELPKGHYKAIFQPQEGTNPPQVFAVSSTPAFEETDTASSRFVASPPQTVEKAWLIGLSTAVILLIITTLLLAVSNLSRKTVADNALSGSKRWDGPTWEPFLESSSPTLLVLGNPPVYRFVNAMDPPAALAQSIPLTPEQTNALADELGKTFIIKNNPAPKLLLCPDEYTGMGEAIGLHRLTDVLRTNGKNVVVKQSRTVSAEDLKDHNVILLGSIWVNEWSGKLPVKEDFVYTAQATIENNAQQSGEDREYKPSFDPATGKLIEDYALITVKPNISGKNTVMVLAGIHSEGTQAAAEYFTSQDRLAILNNYLKQSQSASEPTTYYQALLRVAVDNGIPTTVTLISFHVLREDGRVP